METAVFRGSGLPPEALDIDRAECYYILVLDDEEIEW